MSWPAKTYASASGAGIGISIDEIWWHIVGVLMAYRGWDWFQENMVRYWYVDDLEALVKMLFLKLQDHYS